MPMLSAYRVTREYGGPEEGGWYFDWWAFEGVVRETFDPDTEEVPKPVLASYVTRSGIVVECGRHSVNGDEGDVVYLVEDTAGENASTEVPYYS